jgi:receptor protein-tyrosine kinase
MTSGGAEALRAAVRRSLPIIIALVVLGVIAVNVFKHLQGPRYQANSRVQVPAQPLSSIITGIQPGFVDPQRAQDTAQALAGSHQVYQIAARAQPALGSANDLESATTVTAVPDTDILQFSATSDSSTQAIKRANAVANAYIKFHYSLSQSQINSTLAKLQSTLATLPADSPQRPQLQSQLNKLQLLQGVNSNDALLVQSANSASQTSPKPTRDSLLGFSLGLVIALIVVALREAIDTTVRSETDIEDVLSVPVLASIRKLPRRAQFVTSGRHAAMFADTYALLAAQLAPSDGAGQGTILAVTSALAREGKTTTCANLAVASAHRGTHTLLVDFDFRKNRLSQLFEVPGRAPGVAQVLQGDVPVENALWTVSLDGPRPSVFWKNEQLGELVFGSRPARQLIEDGDTANPQGVLRLLPSGGAMASPHTVQRDRLIDLFADLRASADLVILDTPPALLTVEMTELAQLIDSVLVVVRQGQVSERSLRSLARHANGWPANISGAVLTDVPAVGRYASYYGKE